MSKKSLFGWLLLIVALLAGGWFFATRGGILAPKAPFAIEKKEIHAEDSDKRFAINIEYPVISGLATPALDEKINREIQGDINQLALSFRQDAEAPRPPALVGLESELETSYQVRYKDEHLLSIEFMHSAYSAGAAHPFSFTTTLLYDLGTAEVIPLKAIFRPTSAYLGVLSQFTKGDLLRQLGEEFRETILMGTAPKEEHFKSYLISAEGLTILFDPYQVAPYAAGAQKVTIPWNTLKPQLAENTLFTRFLTR
ncbi:MAG: DUF3298 and DUF4163 domain-containing protein [Patescibacteria group bacterium]